MQAQLISFLEKVAADAALKEQVECAPSWEAVIEIASENGCLLTIEDLDSLQADLTEEELEQATGGITPGLVLVNVTAGLVTVAPLVVDCEQRKAAQRKHEELMNPYPLIKE
jgi:predicted ribosomally synthesized peptide with nif11-like leader